MRNISLTILVIAICTAVNANERIYKKLNKLYATDSELCLEKAKKYISKKPSEASPYYFASSIYFDKTEKSSTARGKYLQMRRSLNYARQFEKFSDDDLKEKVNWNERVSELKQKTSSIVYELDKTDQVDLSQELIANLNKLESIEDLKRPETFEEIEISSAPTAPASPTKSTFIKNENEFYGMPSGLELIPSGNIESEKELLAIINKARISKNLPPLVWNEDLAKAARYHANDLGTQSYFDHNTYDRIDGELVSVGSTFERIKKFYNKTHVNSENIAAGHESPNQTYIQWYNSDGHNKNMFNSKSRFVGIGYCQVPGSPYEYYWVFCTAE